MQLQTAYCPRCKRGPQPYWDVCPACLEIERKEAIEKQKNSSIPSVTKPLLPIINNNLLNDYDDEDDR